MGNVIMVRYGDFVNSKDSNGGETILVFDKEKLHHSKIVKDVGWSKDIALLKILDELKGSGYTIVGTLTVSPGQSTSFILEKK